MQLWCLQLLECKIAEGKMNDRMTWTQSALHEDRWKAGLTGASSVLELECHVDLLFFYLRNVVLIITGSDLFPFDRERELQ